MVSTKPAGALNVDAPWGSELPTVVVSEYPSITLKAFKGSAALPGDYDTVLGSACQVVVANGLHNRGVQLVYLPLPNARPGFLRAREDVAAALPTFKYVSDYRTDGLKTNSRTFGLAPRNTLRHDYCSLSSLDWEQPRLRQGLVALAVGAQHAYAQLVPSVYAAHQEWANAIGTHWRLGPTPWTSGIINCNNPLSYHVDSGNWPAGWSAQYTWRGNTDAGLLVFPQLRVAFELGDGSLLLFNGGQWMHGVTPIKKLTRDAQRFSIVLYARQGAVHCGTPEDEAKRIQTLRTQREAKRGGRATE